MVIPWTFLSKLYWEMICNIVLSIDVEFWSWKESLMSFKFWDRARSFDVSTYLYDMKNIFTKVTILLNLIEMTRQIKVF